MASWDGLTGAKLAVFCRRKVDLNGNAAALEQPLPCDMPVRLFLLEHAVAVKATGLVSFGDWLWEQLTGAADIIADQDEEKKVD